MARDGTTERRLRVAVVDDDEDARLCFRDIFQSEKSFIYTRGFSNAGEALTGLPCLDVDLVLVDISLPDIDGIECTKRLKQLMPRLKVVIVSGNRESVWFDRSLEAGAAAYLIKPVDPAQLIATLRFIFGRVSGAIRIPPEKSEKSLKLALNQREREVLGKLAEGLLYKEIADKLGMSYAAVHKCQHNIFRKLQVTNRSEAARIWLQDKSDWPL